MPIHIDFLPRTPDRPHWVFYARHSNLEDWQTVRFLDLSDSRSSDWQTIQQFAKELQVEFDGAAIQVVSNHLNNWKPKVYYFKGRGKRKNAA